MAAVAAKHEEEVVLGERAPSGSALYSEVLDFLYDEAALLDQNRFDEWAELLATDLAYTAPMRVTLNANTKGRTDVVRTTQHFDDTYMSMMGRLGRLKTKSAWAEDPPSRTRRLVTNVRVYKTAKADEFEAVSYLLLCRSRYEESDLNVLSAERRDRLRRAGAGFLIARREIIVDQSVLGMQNLAVFL